MPLPDSRPDSPMNTISDMTPHKSESAIKCDKPVVINDAPTTEEVNTTVPIDVDDEASSLNSSSKEDGPTSSTTDTPSANVVTPEIIISSVDSEDGASQGIKATSTNTDPVSHDGQDEDKCK